MRPDPLVEDRRSQLANCAGRAAPCAGVDRRTWGTFSFVASREPRLAGHGYNIYQVYQPHPGPPMRPITNNIISSITTHGHPNCLVIQRHDHTFAVEVARIGPCRKRPPALRPETRLTPGLRKISGSGKSPIPSERRDAIGGVGFDGSEPHWVAAL
jgi:hypothetical protein